MWLPADDSKGTFAHSVGLYYLYNLPEILLVSPMPAAIGATSRALALTVNAIAAAMADGTRIKPGDRYALVAETVARTVDSACTLDHVSLGESRFVLPARRLEERTLGAASWFYANFMDVLTYPVLTCLLQPSRAPVVVAVAAAPAAAEAAAPVAAEPEPAEPVAPAKPEPAPSARKGKKRGKRKR